MEKIAPADLIFRKFAVLQVVSVAALLSAIMYWSYLEHHRPPVSDSAAGFTIRWAWRGGVSYLSARDVAIVAGLFVFAVLWGLGCQFYLRRSLREHVPPQPR